jgi:hypothetical protein
MKLSLFTKGGIFAGAPLKIPLNKGGKKPKASGVVP